MHRRSNDPLWWLPFILGGGVAAMFMPALMLVTGVAIPLGAGSSLESYGEAKGLIGSLPGRLFLLLVISLPLFHFAHRFRFTLVDLGVHGGKQAIAFLCYGSAIVGSLLAAWMLVTFSA